ncbi:MAG: hypothetical protein ACTHK7_02725, partial [Aureliella sp.]
KCASQGGSIVTKFAAVVVLSRTSLADFAIDATNDLCGAENALSQEPEEGKMVQLPVTLLPE